MPTTARYFIICVWFTIASKCHTIGIEYYDDNEFLDTHSENSINPNARRIGNDNDRKESSVFERKTSDYLYLGDNVIYDVNKQKQEEVRESLNKSFDYDFKSNSFTSDKTCNSTKANIPMLSSDLLKEYEYIYDDDTSSQILRQHPPKAENAPATDQSGINVKNPLTEFFNLDPAIQHMNYEVYHNSSKSDNLWYTVENTPCWDLPQLYGEFGKKKKTSEVFLIGGGKLKNVIENKDNEWYFSSKSASVTLSHYTSKWCTVKPCYGDHTLCLFSDKTMSILCDRQYKVKVPNILEQTVLVNTLNSMRNKIANGNAARYPHLPPAANMNQILYDNDLEQIAKVWLHQCLPGPAPCSALDGSFVTQLECTKYASHCCLNSYTDQFTKCTPKPECFLLPVIGCLYVWFWSAGDNLTSTDVACGHVSVQTYSTVQLLWATTYKIGCAYAHNTYGDVRVICNFSPGAPFMLNTKLYCGIIGQKNKTGMPRITNITDIRFLRALGIDLKEINRNTTNITQPESKLKYLEEDLNIGADILKKIYSQGWVRKELKDYSNGTRSMTARLAVKYEFVEQGGSRCDSNKPIYLIGPPGSLCNERGRRYRGLCYNFRNPTPGYRLVAVIAPIALFSLILYDLFSGVVRQTNY